MRERDERWLKSVREGLRRMDELLRDISPAPQGFAKRSVRRDRDSH